MSTGNEVRASGPLRVAALVAGALLVAGGVGEAAAQDWPSRPLRMILASPPGGPSDLLGRLVGPQLTQAWGQTVVVDNRSGANGMIAAELTARADPDGHTFLLVNAGFVINTSLYEKVPYDPIKQFAPISLAMAVPNILVVHPSLPVKSVADLVALARAKPGQVTFASAGSGSAGHLSIALFEQLAGVSVIHVPFKGGGPALADVMAGQTQALFSISVTALPQIKAGRVRPLAVTSLKRLSSAPDIPAVAESFKDYEVNGWFGFVAPIKVSPSIIKRLHAEIVKAIQLPELQQRLGGQGAELVGSTPEEFGAYLKSEQAKWARVIRQAGIKPQ